MSIVGKLKEKIAFSVYMGTVYTEEIILETLNGLSLAVYDPHMLCEKVPVGKNVNFDIIILSASNIIVSNEKKLLVKPHLTDDIISYHADIYGQVLDTFDLDAYGHYKAQIMVPEGSVILKVNNNQLNLKLKGTEANRIENTPIVKDSFLTIIGASLYLRSIHLFP